MSDARTTHGDRAVASLALLDEPVRRALYEWVAAQPEPASRDAAAAAVGIARPLAAFHLDRLVRGGLLEADYRRLSGRSGPGAGRPAKLYRRAPREVSVSLPERQYDVAAELLAAAIERADDAAVDERIRAVAHDAGERAGLAARRAAGPRSGKRRRREALLAALRERGYEPRQMPHGRIVFANCPFHRLAEQHRQLVCGMNRELAVGILDGLGDAGLQARLDPQPGRCCVVLEPAG